MTERNYEVITVGVDYICDECSNGVMEPTGKMLLIDPLRWTHKCRHCGNMQNFELRYPTVRFERVKG